MTTTPAAREPGPGSFVDRLRIGESLPIPDDSLVMWDISPLQGERRVKPLLEPVRPDLPAERAAEVGTLLRRVERAVMSLGGTARVHITKWGDGGGLSNWDGLLPRLPVEERSRTNCRIAAALAADAGKAYAL